MATAATQNRLFAAENGELPSSAILLATAEHCKHCFDALVAYFQGQTCPPPGFPNSYCSLFVTWKKGKGNGLRLRGCIGTLEPRHMHSAVGDYALTSALRDRRFQAIKEDEVPSLHCTVSLIFGFQKCQNCMDWEIGVHGLIINFRDPQSGHARSATFLPEVPAQEGWTKQQTIDSLVRKSGYTGAVSQALYDRIELTTYRSSPFSMSYHEYVSWTQTAR